MRIQLQYWELSVCWNSLAWARTLASSYAAVAWPFLVIGVFYLLWWSSPIKLIIVRPQNFFCACWYKPFKLQPSHSSSLPSSLDYRREPILSAREPILPAREPILPADSQFTTAIEPMLPAREPILPAKSQFSRQIANSPQLESQFSRLESQFSRQIANSPQLESQCSRLESQKSRQRANSPGR